MSKPAMSVFVFGLYLVGLGAVLLVTPNTLLALFGVPATNEVWIRILGMVVVILAFYDIQAARAEWSAYFQWSVYTRAPVIVIFTLFVLLGFVSPVLILFGVADLAGAIWTQLALRSSASG